jgi:ribosome-associated heat shock protein Hsp15
LSKVVGDLSKAALMSDSQRLDRWLWSARFYKSRLLAVDAINGGHVHVNGHHSKPSKVVRVGDEIEISKGPYRWHLVIEALAQRRGPASEARQLYSERADSMQQREAMRAERKLVTPAPSKRPDKRQRRKIIRFINKYEQ